MPEKPKKKRISTLAKSYKVSSDLLIQLLKEAEVEVKSSASMISSETFALIKPPLLKEKEKLERKEMAKAGIKIPMKAVLKKSKPPQAKIQKQPEAEPAEGAIEPPPDKKASQKAEGKEEKAEAVLEKTEKPESKDQDTETATTETKTEEKKEEADVPDDTQKEEQEPSEEPEKTAQPLKVTIEKPDEKLSARIQKYITEKENRKPERKTEKGYSGRFGKVPSARKPKRRESVMEEKLQDVFAVRAQQAGVAATGPEAKPDARKESFFQKKKTQKTRGKRKKTKEQIEQELSALKSNVNKVMVTLSRGEQKVRYRKEKTEGTQREEKRFLQVPEFVSISELAALMNITPNRAIAKCMELGMMVTINQRLDHETIAIIADEFGFKVKLMDEYTEEVISEEEEQDEENMVLRAPIITIMGHVDHGKTSILDYIRKSNIVSGETGGITQHIGAYSVETPAGRVCFLDTPGHQAFAAMRSRGAQVTDVVVLVVAADSMVMPQTKEAIQHARNANVQIVVAINKCDLPNANPDKIKTQLAEEGVQVEEWGGTVSCVEVSAKTGNNVDKLLETLAAEAEVLELKADPLRNARGTVVESRLDRGKGAVATILIQDGTIKIGDPFICGSYSGKVRSILDEFGKRRKSAGPSTPVQVLGLEGLPQAGDSFSVMESEKDAREVAQRRREAAKDRELRQKRHISLDQLHEQIESGEFHELKIIIKGDVDGSVEAIATSLENLSNQEVKVNIINQGVGSIKETDVHLAAASNALIIAFHVLPTEGVRKLAEEEGVAIHYYRVIYEVVDEIRAAMEGMLNPDVVEEVTGEARILQLFKIPKIGMIAGCVVTSGSVDRDSQVRLYRDGIEIGEAKVSSLKRIKDDVKSVKAGLECGIGIEDLKEIQVDDILAFFKEKKVARKLAVSGA
ncbi:translation initiation factor IF-2 [Fibrobacterota bacterium]